MGHNDLENVTFQLTVIRLTLPYALSGQDIHVTVTIGEKAKMTCSGDLSEDGLTVSWNHPFLFTAPPTTPVKLTIYTLPELTPGWDRQPMGEQVVENLASLLTSGNEWQCNVSELLGSSGALYMTCTISDSLTMPDGHDCLSELTELDMVLYHFGREIKNLPCLSTQIEIGMARWDLCPLGHADHTGVLNDLAATFRQLYETRGNISDLKKAIEIGQTRLALCPSGHPEHAAALGGLAKSLKKHYHIQKNKEELDMIIDMEERRLNECPPGHPEHAEALENLALSLHDCYQTHKHIADLHKAIELEERGLVCCPPESSNYAQTLGNLATYLITRYHREGDLADLNRAIKLEEQKLELRPPGHRSHGLALRNLALSLEDHFNASEAHSDLIRANQLFKESLITFSSQHRHFASVTSALARTSLLLFSSPHPNLPPPPLDEAFDAYRQLKGCSPAVSLNLLQATQNWTHHAEVYGHSSVLEAYQTSLNVLDHFTSFNPSLDSRHKTMQGRVSDLANNAFSCATRHGDFEMAVQLLEQGRGILWSQLARFDISIAELENRGDRGRALGNEFQELSKELRKHAQGNGEAQSYWQVQQEWQSVVDEIRGLEGFSRFLLPPLFEDLQRAAELGPVIIVNASEYGCDALVVVRAGPPVHVPLFCSLADVDRLCSDLSELTRDASAYGENRESWVKLMLRELWSSVVKPIADVLQNEIELPLGSRIWWCPTSKFTSLPFHAAGPHLKTKKNMFDIYVSSYAPSLSALVRTHDRIRAQKATREASGIPNRISFAAVGQGRPGADMKLGELPEVESEIQRIRNETGVPTEVTFDIVTGDAASVKGALDAFRDHRWVHLACHGSQHAERPFDSWFAMGDGKLTLMRVIQERYANSEFAFLSACHTAVGDASTPDEVLHLAAGMNFAGFNGVIGTLWRVDDAVAHQMVTQFYKEMFNRPEIGFEHAAAALNAAVVEMAGEVSLEKRIVFVHIGI